MALIAAACGGDDGDSSNTTAAPATAAPSDSTDAPDTTGAPATDAPSEPITVKVGVAAPLSGPYVALGEAAVQGIELAAEELAERGVIIELVIEDTASDPQTTLNVFTKLTTQDQVQAILGTLCSACNTAGTQVLEEAGIPQLTIGEGSASACEASGLVVCVVEDTASRVAVIQARAEELGASTVGVIQSELSAPGAEVTEALQNGLPEAGIDVQVALAAADAQDFRTQLTSLRDVDLIVVAGAAAAQSGIVLRNMEDLGMENPVVGLIWSDDILTAADESFVSEHYYFTAAFVAAAPDAADFRAAYADAYGSDPDKYAATGYTSTLLLGEAALALGGADDGAALRAAIDSASPSTPFGASNIVDGVWKIEAQLAQYRDGEQFFVN